MTAKKLRVGILGAGEVTQVIHLPILTMLSHLYTVQIICSLSEANARHCAARFHIPETTTSPEDIFTSPHVDVVFVLTPHAFHEEHAIASLKHGKHVMLEKPVSLSIPSVQRIIEAEKATGDRARVFVGYMRRYALAFTDAFKREVSSIPHILYARARDFPGPNAVFVRQSGTFPRERSCASREIAVERPARLETLCREASPGEERKEVTEEFMGLVCFLNGLGSHDISLMREVLGQPESISGISVNGMAEKTPFISSIFNIRRPDNSTYTLTYESGIDKVPIFDAELAVYGEHKRVSIKYPSPYIKGLPVVVTAKEVDEDSGEMITREIRSSYEDCHTRQLREMHACFTEGKEIKTSLQDALEDLKIFDMMYKTLEKSERLRLD